MTAQAPQRLSPEAHAALAQKMKDPVWRLHHAYKITDKHGRETRFVPTAPQSQLIDAIYRQGQKRHVILKARQLGFSTLIDLILFDAAYWTKNTHAAIVDQTQADASAKLKTKIRFAFDRLPPEFQNQPTISSGSEIAWDFGSSITAGKAIRGGTFQYLHVSELGAIAYEDSKRADEIITGALPAAEQGIIVIEATFKGGKGGRFYELIKRAQETPAEERTEHDYRFWFFPWYLDKSYTLEGPESAVPREVNDYLDEKEQELGITFTAGQRLWYAKTKAQQGIFMLREYPTTVDEAYAAPVEDSIYSDTISKIRANGQIRDFLTDPAYPVYSAWDIGFSDATSVWLFQLIGRDVHWLHHLSGNNLSAAESWRLVEATGIPISANYLPHDAANHSAITGLSYKQALENAGATNLRIIPRTKDIFVGINAAKDILPRSLFHKTHCANGIAALESYHIKKSTGLPEHDWSSHTADAFRYGAEAIALGLIKTATGRRLVHDLDRYQLGTAAGPRGAIDLDALRLQRMRNHSGRALSALR